MVTLFSRVLREIFQLKSVLNQTKQHNWIQKQWFREWNKYST